MMFDFTVFDLETKKFSSDVPGGFKNLKEFGMSCAVTYTSYDGYKHYFHNDVDELLEYLKQSKLVVGFNLKNFDYRVLEGYTDYNFNNLKTFDILEEIYNSLGHHVKLSMLAKANFGKTREGNLMKSVHWYKQGDTTKVKDYCEQDVRITRKLFMKACKEEHLKWHWHNKENRVETLDTSYWHQKAEKLSTSEIQVQEEPPTPTTLPVSVDDMFDISFMMRFKMRMKNEDIENKMMTHDQERAFLGLIENIHQQCEMLKQLGAPIEIYDIETATVNTFKKREIR